MPRGTTTTSTVAAQLCAATDWKMAHSLQRGRAADAVDVVVILQIHVGRQLLPAVACDAGVGQAALCKLVAHAVQAALRKSIARVIEAALRKALRRAVLARLPVPLRRAAVACLVLVRCAAAHGAQHAVVHGLHAVADDAALALGAAGDDGGQMDAQRCQPIIHLVGQQLGQVHEHAFQLRSSGRQAAGHKTGGQCKGSQGWTAAQARPPAAQQQQTGRR